MKFAKAVLLFGLMAAAVTVSIVSSVTLAQVNAGDQRNDPNLPFNMNTVATFTLPWRMAFLPDGRMLVTEKPGTIWIVTPQGQKTLISNGSPSVWWSGQSGMLGVYVSPNYATDQSIYLTYSEPAEFGNGGGLALARARLNAGGARGASLQQLQVLWRQMPKGRGGQEGGALAFAPDGQSLFLTVGDRMRFTPAQDPNQPVGKIIHLTLDGKPHPDNPNFGKTGAATIPLIDPPPDSEAAKTARVVSNYTFPNGNNTPAETWTMGHRTPYGMAFSPTGELWEIEHGPAGGDELNLIEKGKNYGWPLVSYGRNYSGVPIPSHDTRADLAKPAIYWVPVIAPGNLMFYTGKMFPQWEGNGFIAGLNTQSLTRVIFDGKGGAKIAERWGIGKNLRDVAQAPDGSLWLLENAPAGALVRVTPK